MILGEIVVKSVEGVLDLGWVEDLRKLKGKN